MARRTHRRLHRTRNHHQLWTTQRRSSHPNIQRHEQHPPTIRRHQPQTPRPHRRRPRHPHRHHLPTPTTQPPHTRRHPSTHTKQRHHSTRLHPHRPNRHPHRRSQPHITNNHHSANLSVPGGMQRSHLLCAPRNRGVRWVDFCFHTLLFFFAVCAG